MDRGGHGRCLVLIDPVTHTRYPQEFGMTRAGVYQIQQDKKREERGQMADRTRLVGVVRAGLAGEIQHIRNQQGLTLYVPCGALEWPTSKLSRMERGQLWISAADLASLLVIYKVTGDERRRLLTMAERQGDPGYWEHEAPETVESKTLVRLESDARLIVSVEPFVVPDLAQTADYASAVLRSHDVPPEQIKLWVQTRMARQSVLAKGDAPRFSMILAETVLRRMVGDRSIMARQLRTLLEIAERPNVRLHVVPFEKTGNAGFDRSFSQIDFPDGERVIFQRQQVGGLFLDNATKVQPFHNHASRLAAAAFNAVESAHLIAAIANKFE
jgi:hypothetical protein